MLAVAAIDASAQSRTAEPLGFDFDEHITQMREQQAGLAAGSLQLWPSATLALGYDSNLFATATEREEQALMITATDIRVTTRPGPLAASGYGFVRDRRYEQAHDQNATEYGVSGSMNMEITPQDDLTVQLAGQHRFESRTDIETPEIRELSFYNEWRANVSYAHSFNRLSLRTSVGGRKLDYALTNQQFRDRFLYRGDLRAAYRLSPAVSLIATAYRSDEDYDRASTQTSSLTTTGALFGMGWDITEVLEAEFSGGYLQREWDEPGQVTSFTARAVATYRPTRLTSFSASLSRSDAATTVPGAVSKLRAQASLGMLHEYSRSTSVYISGRAVVDEFDAIDRVERAFFATLGVASSPTRRYTVGAEYEYATRNSLSSGRRFVRHYISLSFVGRF